MSAKKKLKSLPELKTDQDAEDFVATADLSEFDLSGFKPMNFEFENKSATISMRLPASQLAAVKAEAKKRGMPYQRFMREMIQRGMQTLQT
ncbi:MAG: hypothetical protein HOK21_18885 [Rhodospirillaceae bacterium]|jgi:predicted DNA binding CopG/RHH family protein|nr:hypothetical protein [Rhodospirillaceae bacterium]MBT5081012.1 hypothetical protein [Rhodospirillaceae bacterium]MBT5526155.1 hypothetical protein [Rhodospirillaceae bacterium]MBT5879683.1 hypothetical protein [Rhodospirillaceae bacterium]MBT6590655.1 hypothetical protein [Rhodospirillaceae bacterium]